jgi:hypothetical protein
MLSNNAQEKASCECFNDGYLVLRLIGARFIVYPRPRTARRDQPAFKVKSVLKSIEYERKHQYYRFRIILALSYNIR